jgi:hypothetical protein
MNTTSQAAWSADQSSRERCTMSNFDATKKGKPSEQELSVEELEKAVGGGANKGASKISDEGPEESLSLSFTKITWSFSR